MFSNVKMKTKVIYIHTIILIKYTLINSHGNVLLEPTGLQMNWCWKLSKVKNVSSEHNGKPTMNLTFFSFISQHYYKTDAYMASCKSHNSDGYLKFDDWLIAKALLMHTAQNIESTIAFITSVHDDVDYIRRIIEKLTEEQQGIKITHLVVDWQCSSSIYITLSSILTSFVTTTVLFLPGLEAQFLLDMSEEYIFPKRVWFILANDMHLYYTPSATSKIKILYLKDIVSLAMNDNKMIAEMEGMKSDHSTLSLDENPDFNRTYLKVATIFDRPFMIDVNPVHQDAFSIKCPKLSVVCKVPLNSTSWIKKCCGGLVLEIFQIVAENIGFKFDLYLVEDGKYGGINSNGSWTGIINEVVIGKADVGIQAITVNKARLNAVDFTEHFMESSFGITLSVSTKTSLLNWKFANFVEGEMLGCFIGTLLLAMFAIFICENIIRKLKQKEYYSIREAFSYTCGIAFQKDIGGCNPTVWPARLVAIVHALGVTIYLTSYTANLTADNVLNANRADFQGLRDEQITKPTSEFTLGVRKGTNTELYFKFNSLKKHRDVYKELKLITDSTSGMEYVYSGSLDAYVDDYIYSLYKLMAVRKYCNSLVVYKDENHRNSVAFAAKKHSKLTKTLSAAILKLKERQKLQKVIAKWYKLKKCNERVTNAHKFPWEYAFSLVVILIIFISISLLILLCEILYWKKKKDIILV